MAHEVKPDIVVMDVSMPGMGGIEATSRIVAEVPHVQVIGLSMHDSPEVTRTLRQADAVNVLNKGGPSEQIVTAIRAHR